MQGPVYRAERASLTELFEGLPHCALSAFAEACAERVLPLFLAARPEDARPAQAVQAAGKWRGKALSVPAARRAAFASHAAAREAGGEAARFAARSAGHAAATAHVPGHAVYAALYAQRAAEAAGVTGEAEWQRARLLAAREEMNE